MSDLNRTNVTGTGANIITPAPVVHKEAVPVVPVAPVAPVAAAPVAGMQNLSLAEKVVHEPEQVIQHAPLIEKEVLREPALEVKREHHVQPIIHETEHVIQPIIKTEATTERPIIEQDKTVMHAPIVERAALPAGLEAVERVAPEGIIHAPKVAKEVVVEHPVQIKHERHVQPIIHEREHHVQPVVKTEVTAEQRVIETEREVVLPPIVEPTIMAGTPPSLATTAATATTTLPRTAGTAPVTTGLPGPTLGVSGGAPLDLGAGRLDTEERLPYAAVPPVLPGEREVYKDFGTGTTTGPTPGHVGIGQKIKGALKEVQGTITRDPAKKEEGKRLMHGTDQSTASTTGL